VNLPYKIATLLYAFDQQGKVLLLKRRRQPNPGLWSPCGGKLEMATGESPHACALREAKEELGLHIGFEDLRLTGVVSERGYANQAHWLMFLFEIKSEIRELPPSHDEGIFGFFSREELKDLEIPETDREMLWPLFWQHQGCGFFCAHCICHENGKNRWILEQSNPRLPVCESS